MSTEQSIPPPAGPPLSGGVGPSGGIGASGGAGASGGVGTSGDGGRQAQVAATRQAEASGQLVAMSFPGARRVAGWLFWVIFPLLCLATIHTATNNVAHHLGKKPAGIRGTFVVQPRSCSQGFCSFGGLFTSDDHTVKNLPLLGDPRWHSADVHRVTYDPKSVEVTALPGHWDPTASVVATFGALTYLGAIGYLLRERTRERNRERNRERAGERNPGRDRLRSRASARRIPPDSPGTREQPGADNGRPRRGARLRRTSRRRPTEA